MPKKKTRRPLPAVAVAAALFVIVAVAASPSGSPSRSGALENVVNKIDSGPSWETQQMSQAVSGYLKWEETDNGNDGGGGCAFVNGQNANAGFACYLQASESNGGGSSYFSESKSGGSIKPISSGQYSQLLGNP